MDEPLFWTEEDIAEYYDSHPNITLEELSFQTGRAIAELKEILMG